MGASFPHLACDHAVRESAGIDSAKTLADIEHGTDRVAREYLRVDRHRRGLAVFSFNDRLQARRSIEAGNA
jgi:hypothetical protein